MDLVAEYSGSLVVIHSLVAGKVEAVYRIEVVVVSAACLLGEGSAEEEAAVVVRRPVVGSAPGDVGDGVQA